MEKFLNQFLRLRPEGDTSLPLFDYDKPISMDTTNFKRIRFSNNLSMYIDGGTIKLKNGDRFDLNVEVRMVAKEGKKLYQFDKEWVKDSPIKSMSEVADFETLIKNLLALNYVLKGDEMFAEADKGLKKLFKNIWKKEKEIDINQVDKLKANINNIVENKPLLIKPEELIGNDKLNEIISKSIEFAREQSLRDEMDIVPTYDP